MKKYTINLFDFSSEVNAVFLKTFNIEAVGKKEMLKDAHQYAHNNYPTIRNFFYDIKQV